MKHFLMTLMVIVGFTSCDILSQVGMPLTELDVANGLKEALTKGVKVAGNTLTAPNSFGGNMLLNELLPQDAVKALNLAKQLGLGGKVDNITNMLTNAATKTVERSVPIFINSITQMSFQDAWGILRGGNGAGTNYLRKVSTNAVIAAIKPEVTTVFAQVGLKPTLLQNFGVKNPALGALDIDMTQLLSTLVANKIFSTVETQENKIRTDINERTSALLQRVFAAATQPAPSQNRY